MERAGTSMWRSMRVEERPADAGAVSLDLWHGAAAFVARIAEVAAGAGIHGGHEHEA